MTTLRLLPSLVALLVAAVLLVVVADSVASLTDDCRGDDSRCLVVSDE